MAQLVLWVLLPVFAGAMVLLQPEDEREVWKIAQAITALEDRADRVYRDHDWDYTPLDTVDLSVLDGLPDLQVVRHNVDHSLTGAIHGVHDGDFRTDPLVDSGSVDRFQDRTDSTEDRPDHVSDTDSTLLTDGGVVLPKLRGLEDSDNGASLELPARDRLNLLYQQVARMYGDALLGSQPARNSEPVKDVNDLDGKNGWTDDIDEDDENEDDDDAGEEEEIVDDSTDDVQNDVQADDETVISEQLPGGEAATNDLSGPSQIAGKLYQGATADGFEDWNHLRDSSPATRDRPRRRVARSARSRQTRARRERAQKRTRELKRRGRMSEPRKRNQMRVDAQVEVLVVVENSLYRHFLATNHNNHQATLARIRRYYGIVFAMVDQRYQTIDHDKLSIAVRISGILIAESREDSSWMEKLVDWSTLSGHGKASVNTDKALNEFGQFIKLNFAKLPKFDHAMVFSGYRLTNTRGVTVGGKAYLNAICDVENGNSVSIVHDSGDFQCVKVAAHELGHSLGSVHDGDPGVERCPLDGNYVMAPVATPQAEKLKNAFYFSPCSIQQMRKLLRKKKARCVRDEPKVSYSYDMTRLPPGQLISPDHHCQLIYGEQSTFCQEPEPLAVLCGQLWCRDPQLANACRTNSYLTALPGTKCGDEKTCHLGECLSGAEIWQSRHQEISSSSSPHGSSPASSDVRGVVAGSPQSQLAEGEAGLDNTIPTLPRSVIRGRVGRGRRRGQRTKTGGQRNKDRSRRKGRCKVNQPDENVEYCRGLVTINPGACKRRDIKNYCCRTCSFAR